MRPPVHGWPMRFIAETYTVAFYRQDAGGRPVEVNRFPASPDMVAAYCLAPDAAIDAARRKQRGQPIDGLRIISAAGRTVFQHPAVAHPHVGLD